MNAITNELISANKEYYLKFFETEIKETIYNTLVNTDFEEDKSIHTIHVEMPILNLTLEFSIFGAKLAYKNRYAFDGELVGKFKKECDHDYEIDSVFLHQVWCDKEEDYIELVIKEELNAKLLDIWKL